jgi:hypothetical protein
MGKEQGIYMLRERIGEYMSFRKEIRVEVTQLSTQPIGTNKRRLALAILSPYSV